MAKSSEKGMSEKFQVAMLTFAMTGGGFALVSLVLVLLLNPSAKATSEDSEKKYNELTKLLSKSEVKSLREQAKLSEAQGQAKSLSEIVSEKLQTFQLEFSSFPEPKSTDLRAGLVRLDLDLSLKPAKLSSVFQFLGAVKDAKKTVKAETLTINRDRTRSKTPDDDSWSATIHFVDYVSK
jgi:hypothetical protein